MNNSTDNVINNNSKSDASVSTEEKRTMFNDYDLLSDEVEAAKKLVETLSQKRSLQVKKIHDTLGPGPFKLSQTGEIVRIVVRGDTYFFRGRTNNSNIEVV